MIKLLTLVVFVHSIIQLHAAVSSTSNPGNVPNAKKNTPEEDAAPITKQFNLPLAKELRYQTAAHHSLHCFQAMTLYKNMAQFDPANTENNPLNLVYKEEPLTMFQKDTIRKFSPKKEYILVTLKKDVNRKALCFKSPENQIQMTYPADPLPSQYPQPYEKQYYTLFILKEFHLCFTPSDPKEKNQGRVIPFHLYVSTVGFVSKVQPTIMGYNSVVEARKINYA